ncbi:MAG: type II CRISPR RNA-guided endonuclease Cas9, partial [Rhodocyclaceae bacterium]|nr:type II CRISPR RNA-guided endonuclease Cas9 [Rhodocyclaceae bacterium]
LARRTARLARHRLQHRKWRLMKLARLLKREGLIDDARLFAKGLKLSKDDKATAWELRRKGLNELLTPQQWARVIYHLAKHRGFYWASKAEEAAMGKDAKGEGGKVKKGLQASEERMRKEGKNYRSAAEMLLGEFPEAQRNKDKQYDKALSRILLGEELALLFQHQRALGNPHASERLQTKILGTGDRKSGLFWQQKPALSGEKLLKMLGKCTFERNEYRAPKASFSAERHVWLTRLLNLRIIDDGRTRPLTQDERKAALLLPYEKETVKFKTLKTALKKAGLWNDAVRPAHGGGKGKDPEEQTLIKLTAWHELRKAFEKADRKDLWQRIRTPALEGNPELLDKLTRVLSIYKDDDEVAEHLRNIHNLPEPEACLRALERIRFSTFSNLSLKALRRIVPLMETGLRYDEAVAQIPEYGHHSQLRPADAPRAQYLPPLYESTREKGSMKLRDDIDAPRNPVVLRALNQARKVLNALVREYGSPTSVHIEMARDLSRPLKERREIEEAQNQYRKRNEQDRAEFERDHPNAVQADRRAFAKFQLYKEQQCKCAYSQQPLDLHRVVHDPNYVQIDHILPYSRSYDDSKNNKVLVLARENQNKGNRTPYEYLTSLPDGEQRWRAFEAWAENTHGLTKAKRNRLLRKHFDEKEASEFRARNLNDTRYICRFFKNYVENNLQFSAGADGEVSRRCVVVNGQLTAFLRARWGLVKKREGSDRHHALDAAVIAACTHGMVKRLADYARRDELKSLQEGFADPETGEILNPAAFNRVQNLFPEPWP